MTKCELLLPTLYSIYTTISYHLTKWFILVWSERTSEEAASCHLQIVDQVIDFRDLLELKYLSSLYIDWHDDAVNLPSWFPDMLVKEDWKKVAQKLVSLEAQLGFKTNNDHLKGVVKRCTCACIQSCLLIRIRHQYVILMRTWHIAPIIEYRFSLSYLS